MLIAAGLTNTEIAARGEHRPARTTAVEGDEIIVVVIGYLPGRAETREVWASDGSQQRMRTRPQDSAAAYARSPPPSRTYAGRGVSQLRVVPCLEG